MKKNSFLLLLGAAALLAGCQGNKDCSCSCECSSSTSSSETSSGTETHSTTSTSTSSSTSSSSSEEPSGMIADFNNGATIKAKDVSNTEATIELGGLTITLHKGTNTSNLVDTQWNNKSDYVLVNTFRVYKGNTFDVSWTGEARKVTVVTDVDDKRCQFDENGELTTGERITKVDDNHYTFTAKSAGFSYSASSAQVRIVSIAVAA